MRTSLRQEQGRVREIKCGNPARPRQLGASLAPVQAAGNHQMHDEPEIVLQADTDAFAHPAQAPDLFAFRFANRRSGGAQEERTGNAYALECLSDDARLQRVEIKHDVGQFRHGGSVIREIATLTNLVQVVEVRKEGGRARLQEQKRRRFRNR